MALRGIGKSPSTPLAGETAARGNDLSPGTHTGWGWKWEVVPACLRWSHYAGLTGGGQADPGPRDSDTKYPAGRPSLLHLRQGDPWASGLWGAAAIRAPSGSQGRGAVCLGAGPPDVMMTLCVLCSLRGSLLEG